MDTIYSEIATRTGGNIYIGVIGPVRTGKSTFIKRIMEIAVIPEIQNPYEAERARDELPQSGSGKTIMTSEPKFVPEDAAEISLSGKTLCRVRLIDSVGYMVNGAVGAEENGQPRMVTTPWFDHEIPLTEAAEIGTKKVMEEHCSIGIVVTTDGTITDIPREDYREAESRAIADMAATGKPFLIVINSKEPNGESAKQLRQEIHQNFHHDPIILDCQTISEEEINALFKKLLYQFPLGKMEVTLPRWIDALSMDDPVKKDLYRGILDSANNIASLDQLQEGLSSLSEMSIIKHWAIDGVDLGAGAVSVSIQLPAELYYNELSRKTGLTIRDDSELLSKLTELSNIQHEYDRIADALSSVKSTGYGVVMPTQKDMQLQKPEATKKGGAYGVKIKAKASSIHMIRVDIDTEVSPMVGDESQSKALIAYLSEQSTDKLWDSNIFGRTVFDLIHDGFQAKLLQMPADVQNKFRGCLTKIANEGASGLICIIL